MRISPIVIRLRTAITDYVIAGAAELDVAIRNVLKKDCMFVVPISESCADNQKDSGIDQKIIERFAVVVALANDVSDKEKTGVLAYDKLHEIRSRLFRAFLGYEINGAESNIYYKGATLWGINAAYLWYQYDFEITTRIIQYDGYNDVAGANDAIEGQIRNLQQRSTIDDLNSIYSQFLLWPDADLPWTGDIPVDTSLPDMSTFIDFTDDPTAGAFDRSFGEGFDFYKILNRRI